MFSKINNIIYLKNEPLSQHSSFNVGGNAKHFVVAKNIDALLDTLNTCKQHSINFKLIGNGSNMLFDDLGFEGVIIKYADDLIEFKNSTLNVSSGATLSSLIQFCQQHDLGGFEFAIGVPAQVGGAIVNNLGAYNQQISDYIKYVTVLKNNKIVYLPKDDCKFSYHSSGLQNGKDVVLGATFNPPFQEGIITRVNALEFLNKRKSSQPLDLANAGSIFRRDKNIIPARLIDEAGLKGLSIGNAQVSTKHAGFIVNLGNAKCSEILKLIELIKNKIYEKYKINLQTEIEYLPYI